MGQTWQCKSNLLVDAPPVMHNGGWNSDQLRGSAATTGRSGDCQLP
jgi:hypothetical protein